MNTEHRCRALRTKNGYGEVSTPAGDGWASLGTEDALWCVQTGRAQGPDRRLVVLANCVAGRPCFQGELVALNKDEA
ncbi:MAG: hypothetical protein U1E65_06190 [Myxococcota bacterium]